MLESGCPEVTVLSTPAERLESGDDDTDKEPPSKKHHGAGTEGESSPSNSQRVSNDTHANGGDPEQIDPSGNLHPKLVKALSQVPYSPLFGILWPIIIEQASFETRDLLREVNAYFEAMCHPYRRSDRAKDVRFPNFTMSLLNFQRVMPHITESRGKRGSPTC